MIQLGLERILPLLAHAGNPHHNFKCIHIAGSNGKGSIGTFISRSIKNSGHFSSPFIKTPRDCIRLDSKVPSLHSFDEAQTLFMRLNNQFEIGCSDFEILTAVCFKLFSDFKVSVAVIEVGLGGLMDATNCIPPPIICVFSSISMDHTEFLGDSIESISKHKAGILKEGVMAVVVAPQSHQESIPILKSMTKCRLHLVNVKCDSVGEGYQKENICTAVKVLEILSEMDGFHHIKPDLNLIINMKYAGRLENITYKSTSILVDGCHNDAGAASLKSYLSNTSINILWIFAASSTKDVKTIIKTITRPQDILIPLNFSTPVGMPWVKSKPVSEICQICNEVGIQIMQMDSLKDALEYANDCSYKVVLCGSLYLVSDLYNLLDLPIG
jgi:folylpolyglutamate synthase/dihydropteroate synthase